MPPGPPVKPTGLEATTQEGSLDVSVDWDDVDEAAHYLVRWRVAGPGNTLNTGVEVQSSDANITVDDYGEWVVRVQACNDAGCGQPLVQRFEVEPAAPATQVGNFPPTFDDGAGPLTRSVAENSAADTAVGAAVAATDPDGDTLAYTLTGTDAGSFTVDASGQIEVGQGTSLDYETKTGYSVTVNVSDGKDAQGGADTVVDATVDVTINVTDVEPENLPPYFPFAISGLILEEAGDIGDVLLPEAEGGDGEFTYSLTSIPTGLSFDAASRTLSGTLAEAGEHTMVYAATDEAGVSADFSFTITVGSLEAAESNQEDIDWRRPRIRDMRVVRTQYSEPSAPGLSVSWNAPDMSTNSSGETDLVVEQYELRYTKTSTLLWTDVSISKDSRSVVLAGLEAGAEYHVRMRVKYSGARYQNFQFANAEGDHTTNRPPKLASGRLNPTYVLEWGGNDSVQTISDDFTDADGDALTYSVSSTPAGAVTATLEDEEVDGNTTKKLRIHLLNPITGAANVTYGAHDGYGGYVFQVISVGGISYMTRTIAEDADAGDAVGAGVTGTPYGTEKLTYTLTGEASTSGAFEIDSSTGQVSVAEGATLDHEAKSSYTGKVKWTVNGQAAEVNLTINVTDVKEPPLALVNPQITSLTDTSFTVTWEAPDNTGRPAITEFELKSEHPDSTVTTHKTPDGTTYSISLSSLDPGTTYALTLKGRNADGDGAEREFTATTSDYRPRSADFTKYFKNSENAAFSQSDFPFYSDEDDDVLGHVKFTSIPTSEGAFKLKQSDDTLSNVAANSLIAAGDLGGLVFVPVTNFDGSAAAQFKVIDHESDESGSTYTLTLRRVANIPPSFGWASPLSREIPENSAGGTAVGAAVTATDPDSGDTLTYSLSGTDASSFTIDSATGQISVAAGTVLDYEADKNTYQVQVGVSDGKANDGTDDTSVDSSVTVKITVTNVNEGAPPSVDFAISEITATSVLVTVTPPDTTGTSPIERYAIDYTRTAQGAVGESASIQSGTSATLTGLTPSTAYEISLLAINLDGESGPATLKTVTTLANTAPTSADFTKKVSRQTGATFSKSDFPFTDPEPGDTLHKVKIVTLPDATRNHKNRRRGELRFDGNAATAGQLISVDDLGKLKYVPQPDGFRLSIESSFTFKVLDGIGAESPTYTVTLEQIPDIKLSVSPGSISESSTPSTGGRVTVTGTLTGPVRTSNIVIPDIMVDIDHDARENSDYTVNTNAQRLTIPAGQKSASITFEFTGIEDLLLEGDEGIRFYPNWTINGIFSSDNVTERVSSAILTLEDNDRGVVTISGPPGEVEEGEDAVFTVTLSRGIAAPLTVVWGTSPGGTALLDKDLVSSNGTVTFPAGSSGNSTMQINVPVVDDLEPETTERFTVVLGGVTGKAASQISIPRDKRRAGADIAENDAVTVSLSGDARVTEGESATYTISLDSSESTQPITVDYVTTDQTAAAGTDYTAATGTVTIAAGQTSATVTVATTDNEDDEANRYFEFRMSNPQGGGGPTPLLSTTQFVDTTIVDNDGDPSSAVLTVDKTSFGEADAAGIVNVTATLEGGTLTEDATVAVTLGGSATEGSSGDYTATTLGNITITGGETSGTGSFTVTPSDDRVVEGDESILLQGASAGLDVTPATITITDDDTATLGITGPTGAVTEGGKAEFTVTLSHEVAAQVVVAWSAGSTAQTPASEYDYSPDSGSVIFPAGSAPSSSKKITMAIADDGSEEEQETFTVTLGSVTGDLASRVSLDSSRSSADATIADAGEVVTVTLVGPRAYAHVRNTDFAVYHVFLSGPANADVQVDVSTADGTATGCDSAINNCTGGQTGDYGNVSKTLTIGPSKDTQHNANKFGVTWYTVFVHFTDHPRSDPDETFTISLSNLRGGGTTPVVLGSSSVTTTIKSTPLTFSVSGPEIVDEGTNARFIVTRNVDLHSSFGARVSYTTKDGTAEAGKDYTAVSGRLEMPVTAYPNVPTNEEYRQRNSDWEVLVPILTDNTDESDETFSLVISNPQRFFAGVTNVTAAQLGTATATTTISDRAMTVSVSGPETVTEGGNADFTVTLSRAPTANLTVNYQTYSALAPRALATSGADYTAQSGTLTFVSGETSKRVRVPILTDSTREVVEYFRLILASPAGGGGLTPTLGTSIATTGIVDAAGPLYGGALTVTPDSSIGEGDTTATDFTVKVDLDCCTTFDDPTTVTVSLTGTATVTDDYSATIANVTIPVSSATGSASLSITPADDSVVEGGETIVVNGSAPGLLVTTDTIDLTDNDTATLSITGPADEVEEGSNAEFTVTLSTEVAKETTVAWSTPLSTDTAVAADLGATSGSVTFAAGSAAGSTQTVSIPITDDTDPEPAETFTVSLGAVGGDLSDLVTVDSTASSATATIATSDASVVLSISSAPASVVEGQSATFTVKKEGDVNQNVTVVFQTGADGDLAVAGEDYGAVSRTLTFLPTDVTKTVTVQTAEDQWLEAPETFTVSLSNAQGGDVLAPVISDGKKTTTIIDNFKDRPEYPDSYTLTASPTTVSESDAATQIEFTVTLEAKKVFPLPVDVVVQVADSGWKGTAAYGDDYTVTGSHGRFLVITVPPNRSSGTGTLGLDPVEDNLVEGDETVVFTSVGGGGLKTSDRPAITISDVDARPTSITLSASPSILREGPKSAKPGVTVTAKLDGSVVLTTATTVAVSLEGDTAVEGSDYAAGAAATITISAGEFTGSAVLSVRLLDDDVVESDESLSVTGTASGFTVSPVELLILDDDGAPDGIRLHVSPSIVREDAGATNVTVTASFRDSNTLAHDTVIDVSLADGTATIANGDYSASTGRVTIPAEQSYGTGALTFTPANDSVDEFDESVVVEGTIKDSNTNVTSAVITIRDKVRQNLVGRPGAPVLTRTRFTEPTPPGLLVKWTAPPTGGSSVTGYRAQYRKKAAAGEDPAAWTVYSGTLSSADTSLDLTGLEEGATYEAQVRAVTGEGDGPWSLTGEGTANRPPAATRVFFGGGTFPVGSVLGYHEAGNGAIGVLFGDADGDTLTYSASAQHHALLGVELSGDAGEAQLDVTLLNQGTSKVNYTASDGYGGSVTRSANITITAKTSRSIAEGSAAGTAVGDPVTGTPYDDGDDQTNDALTYTLTGNAAASGLFVIDSATGQISVAENADIDYETDDSHRETETWNGQVIAKFYRGKVNYTVDGHDAVIDVNILVTDVEAGKPGTPSLARTQFSEPTDPALDVTWTAAAANGTTITGYEAQYRKKGETSWTDYTGAVDSGNRTLTLPDLEAGATYETRVRAWAWESGEPDITLSVNPTSFDENTASKQITVTATRAGTAGSVSIALSTSGGTATDGTDFTTWAFPTLTIADGSTSGTATLTITAWDDELEEGNESIIVSGTATGLTVGKVAITIIDEESPGGAITVVDGKPGPWSDTGEGTANRPPTASSVSFLGGTLGMGGSFAWHEEAPLGNGAFFTDADGDTLTYSASAQHPALLGVSLSGTAGSAVLTANLLNQGASKVNYTASDGYGGQVTRSANITITAKTSRSVAEGSAAGTAVGDPVTGTPYDDGDPESDDALSYSLTGKAKDSGLFVIDSATGQISVATGATIDYETDDTNREIEYYPPGVVFSKFYRGKVNYTVDGHASAIEVLILITDIGAGKPAAPTVTRTEFSQQSSPALDVTWTAPSASGGTITGYKAQYRKKAAAGEDPAAWTAYTGTLGATATTLNLPNLEAGATYEAQVRAVTSEDGDGPWSDTGEGTANRPPTASSVSFLGGTLGRGGSFAWHEAQPLGSGAFFTDPDNDTLTYSASAQHPALLGVSLTGTAGTNAVLTANLLNQGASKVNYTASDGYGGQVTRSATITITAKTSRSIAENSPAGTAVGDPVTGTPYDDGDDQTNDALTYTLTGKAKDSGLFVIDSATGQISVATGAVLDYEAEDGDYRETEIYNGEVIAKFYRGKVNYTVDGHAAVIDVNILITDVDTGKPAAPTVTRTEFSEQSNPALDVTWTAPSDPGGTITGYKAQYRKKAAQGEDPAAWTAYTGTLAAMATTLNLPDLEAGATYEAQVRAVTTEEGDGPWSDTGEGTANRPPTASKSINNFSLQWFKFGNWISNTDLSNGFFHDADGDTISYSTSSAFPGVIKSWIESDGKTLKIQTRNPTRAATTVTYGAHDPYGGYVSRTVDVTGTMGTVQASIIENACCGRYVRNITGVPYNDGNPETDDSLTYTLTGDAFVSGPFVHDASSGWISLGSGKSLDYETKNSYTATLSWTVQEKTASVTVNIRVTDVEAGKPNKPTLTRTEYSEPTDPGLDVTWMRPALTGEVLNRLQITGYEVQYRKKAAAGQDAAAWTLYKYDDPENADTKISELPATPTSLTLPGLEAGATYEAQVRAIGGVEGPGAWSDTGEGTANRPPNLTATFIANFSQNWFRFGNSLSVSNLSTSGIFQDADGDTMSYSASSEYPGVIKAWIDSDGKTLKIQTRNPAAATVTYGAHDAYGGYASRTVEVTGTVGAIVANVPENTPVGNYVRLIKGDAYNGEALTYTYTGDAFTTGTFTHDAATGWISVAKGLDHETKDSYTATLSWTVQDQTASATVTINITDLQTSKAGTPTLTRTEFSEPSDPALDITWTAAPTVGYPINPLTVTGYEVQYRKKVAEGEDANAWTDYTYTNSNDETVKLVSGTSLTLPGLDTGATYEVQVRAVTAQEGPGPWSDTGEGTANRPPTASSVAFSGGTLGVGGSLAWPEQAPLGNGAFFTDLDSDTLTYSASAQHPALLSVSLTGTAGTDAVLTANLLNQGASKVNFTASDPYGGQVTRSANVTIIAKTSREIAEGSAVGTSVGDPVTGTPYDDGDPQTSDALIYTLTGKAKDSGLFVIDSATGQISVATGASIDYETDDSHRETETHNGQVIAKFYRGKVNYTVDGHNAAIDVIIKVTDVNPAPVITDPGDKTYKQGEAITAFDITVTDAEDETVTVTLSGLPSGLSYSDGQVSGTVAQDATVQDYTVTISADDGGNDAATETFTISVTAFAAPTGITLSVSPSNFGEDDGKTEFTVKAALNGVSTLSSNTVVTIGTLSGTATSGTDYSVNTALTSITIPANSTSGTGTLEITPTDDAIVEGDETIIVSGTTTTQVGLSVTSATITLTDDNKTTTTPTDDKDTTELSISGPANVAEGGNAVFTVTLSQAIGKEVSVAWSAPLAADAAEAADLGTTSGAVTFAANSAAGATQSITVAATDDKLSETAESFTATLGAITSTVSSQVSLKSGASSATATIAESDPITISITGPSTVDEGDATTNYTVSLSPSGVTPTSDLTVSYATADGTATAATDYTAKSGTLTFTQTAPGSQTFTVQTTEDTIDEGTGETLTVAISSPSGGGGPSPALDSNKSSVTTTITDDDDSPTGITLSASPSTLGEDDSATSVTVKATLNGGTTRTSSTLVTIGTLAGSATKDTDYTVTSLAAITIPANSTSATGSITITPTDDVVVEGDETITIPGTTTVGLTVSSATITLTDDDKTTTTIPGDKDSAELSISGPTSNVAEGSEATFTVTLSKAVAAEVKVAWSTPLGTDAAEAADLSATSGTVTFAANSAAGATQSITITASDDKLSETAESFTVTLGTITSTLSSQLSLKNGSKAATATIAASDPITISISGPSSVDEGDATTNYTVSLSPSGVTPTADLTVSYGTSDGTANAGSDYTAKSGTLTFTNAAPGSQTFTVQTAEDTIDEGTGETYTVTISSPSGGGGSSPSLDSSKTSVTTTITDDDEAPSGIALSANPSTIGEDDGKTSITVTATLSGGTTRTSATVVTIGTLSGTATKDTDYAVNTALTSITIPANSTSGTGTLEITPTDDSVVEGDETIVVSGTTTTQVGLTVSSATITLTDDNKTTTTPTDDKDTTELLISGPASNVSEGGNAVFTVTLSQAVAKQVTVAWSAPLGTDSAAGTDLGTTSGTVTFAANSAAGATQSITISAIDDKLSETAESFTVTLGNITTTISSQVSLKSGASSATATIAESDPIAISISGPASVDEGDATTNYTVSLSPSGVTPTSDLTVSYATANGTATAGSDYTAKSGTLTFTQTAAGSQTFTVQTTEDTLDESTGEIFTVTISSPSGGGGQSPSLATSKSVTTTITDDDDAPTGITLSANPSTLGEDDAATSITITATLNGDSTRTSATVVTIGTLAGTATKGTDYTATSLATITIPANSTSGTGTFTLTPTDDSVVEGDETITIPGTTTAQVNLSVSSATITLTDDDKTTTTPTDDKDSAVLSISGPASNVAEGSNATFTVTLSKAVAAEVKVAWSAPLGTDAAASADLGTTSGTVTFAANSAAGATKSITITATDDALSETAESFTVTLGMITSTLSSQLSLKNGAKSATATIAASDPITISISGPSSVDEGDTTTTYTVSLSPSGVTPTADLTVSYATANGTATADTDYTAKSGTLTFTNAAPGAQTFTVSTTEDTVDEGTGETFTVAISNPSGGGGPSPSLDSSKTSVTTTITDDDDAPSGITLSANPSTLGEDDGKTAITVTAALSGGTTRTSATVVTIGALSGTATKDTDYAVNTSLASITIPANSTSGTGTLEITPIDDSAVEGDETIIVSGTTTTQVGLSVTSATVTLTDDNKTTTTPTDDKDTADLSISGPTSNVSEGSNAVFSVTLSAAIAKEVAVAWSAPLSTDTAKSADLGTTSGTVTFAANSAAGATQSITITASDDKLSETAESFTLTLGTITSTVSSQVSLKSSAKSATATIAESDPITISISGPSSVNEGDATTNYTVSLSPSGVKPTADLTVSYATANGTATAGTDYTAKSGTLTFTNAAAGSQTFTVQTTEDTIDEGTGETFTVAISSPSGGGGPSPSLGTSKTLTTTITDDDDAPTGITLSANPSTLGEDDAKTSITVTATLDGGTTRTSATVVTISALSGTATKDTDYAVNTALTSITIPANSTSGTGTLEITPTDDSAVEGDETIIVSGTTTTQVGLNVSSATITLTDDDKSTTTVPGDKDSAELSISGPASNVSEGGNAVFTVTLSDAIAKKVTVAWSAPLAADAADGADLSATSGTVTFAANSAAGATQSITITASDDKLSETAESFTVTLGSITSTLSSQLSLKNGSKSATATIAASDPITISISGPSSVNEGDATTNYTVSLSPTGVKPTADLTVSYATANGTATAGTDYTAKSGTMTFTNAAAGAQTFTVSTTEDTIDEGTGETFTVAISSPSSGGGPAPSLGTSNSVTTTITDDDDAPTGITLSANPSTLGEDDGKTSITVTAALTGSARTSDTVVTIGTLSGTATSGTDYSVNTALTSITIPCQLHERDRHAGNHADRRRLG